MADKPVLLRFDPANDPIVRLYLTGAANLYQARYVAEEVLKKDLESTEGVAAININGGYEEEIQVRVDQGKLSLMGLSITDVNDKLRTREHQPGGWQSVRVRGALSGPLPQRISQSRRHHGRPC